MSGLCETCRHQRLIRNTRGSVFSMCELSRVDTAFSKYPPLPVLNCGGYSSVVPAEQGDVVPAEQGKVSSAEPRSRPPS